MPELSRFEGMVIKMLFNDTVQHNKPHVHVTYGEYRASVLLISQFVTNQICSHVTDLPSFVSLAFLYNPADFLPDYLFHLQCYI